MVNSKASGNTSFVHGSNSSAIGTSTIILGDNITGSSTNTIYVSDLVIKKSSATPSSSGDTVGEIGSLTWDNNYIYIKTNTGWGRTLLDYVF